ncbi:hypothetical protein ACNPP3_002552, partial [Vibrio vulnificus]
NAETASPIIVILANAGIHLPARTEHGVGESAHSGKHPKCRESTVNAVVPSTHNERFRMDPRLREDDKQKTKETSKQENVWDGVEYFCLQKACRTTDANSAQIRLHYRATPTIAVILANAGIHLSARTEQCVGISTHSGKHSKCRESKVNAVVPSTRSERFRMDPRLREDDKQKTKETSKRMFGIELSTFVSRKLLHDRREQRSNSFPL